MRIGQGYDVHRLVENRRLILGGVDIPYEKGLLGHSDADVLTHAVCDALLGAAKLGDIGLLFPDSDLRWKDADSLLLLQEVCRDVYKRQHINFFHFMIDLQQGPCAIKRLRGCGCGNEYVAVTPEGDVYPCHQFVGMDGWKMGSVLDNSLDLKRKAQFAKAKDVYKRQALGVAYRCQILLSCEEDSRRIKPPCLSCGTTRATVLLFMDSCYAS